MGDSTAIQTAATIARTVAAPLAAEVDAKGRFPRESIEALAHAGLFGLCLPADVGGRAEGPSTYVGVVEELAQACASTAMIYVMHVSAAQAIAAAGPTLEGKSDILRAVSAGKHLTTLALSEKGSRSLFWLPMSKLEERGDGFVTSAYKSWVTSASAADSYVSSAQKPGAASPLESAVYLLRKGAPGVRVAGPFDGLGLRGNDSTPVSLEALAVRREDLISDLGGGLKIMLEVVLPWFAIGTAAMANGICRAAVTLTAEHLGATGFDSGSKLRDIPVLRARLAEMSAATEQSRALTAHTAREMESPTPRTPLFVLESRLSALEAALAVTDLGMKTCGGAAFSKHLGLERLFRDARAGWVMAPTADHLKDFIGKALTGLPLL
jgi:alkylation response protein AidB-like acyl-CoA dehydrogenase